MLVSREEFHLNGVVHVFLEAELNIICFDLDYWYDISHRCRCPVATHVQNNGASETDSAESWNATYLLP